MWPIVGGSLPKLTRWLPLNKKSKTIRLFNKNIYKFLNNQDKTIRLFIKNITKKILHNLRTYRLADWRSSKQIFGTFKDWLIYYISSCKFCRKCLFNNPLPLSRWLLDPFSFTILISFLVEVRSRASQTPPRQARWVLHIHLRGLTLKSDNCFTMIHRTHKYSRTLSPILRISHESHKSSQKRVYEEIQRHLL